MPSVISEFHGAYRFLSNFWPSLIEWNADPEGIIAPTVEHAFQALKTLKPVEMMAILRAETPGDAKRLGRKCTLRDDWDDIKDRAMLDLLRLKFSIPALGKLLIATNPSYLIEGNSWNDHYWGFCNGWGHNKLGHALMRVRKELIDGAQS